jgi:3-oxoacyl-[acyl-carrier protein] reductase
VGTADGKSLEGRVALVTGGSRGIGVGIARYLAEQGARIVLNYRSNEKQAQKVLEEIQKISPDSFLSAFDVSKPQEVDSAFEELLKKTDRLDILVCNAGISRDALLPRSASEHFEEVFRTNVFGTINCVRAASRTMMRNRYGRVICIGSVVGQMGNKGQSAYASSKSALFGFCKSVARELATRNITCNIVSPGFIETEMTQELANEVKQAYLESIPLQRFGRVEDVAGAVAFLASENAGYITGTNIEVNGGLYMSA